MDYVLFGYSSLFYQRRLLRTSQFGQIFLGAVMGTSVATHIFVNYGWRAAAVFNLGLFGWQLFILLIRGPHCDRYTWVGWQGGLEPRKSVVEERGRWRQEEIEMDKEGRTVVEVQNEKEDDRRV